MFIMRGAGRLALVRGAQAVEEAAVEVRRGVVAARGAYLIYYTIIYYTII